MVKAINEAVEIERQERIKTLREMADGRHDSIFEVADTNAKLSKVHNELKRIFQYIEVSYAFYKLLWLWVYDLCFYVCSSYRITLHVHYS